MVGRAGVTNPFNDEGIGPRTKVVVRSRPFDVRPVRVLHGWGKLPVSGLLLRVRV